VRELVGDPERRARLGAAARADAERFSVAARIGTMVDLYRELLSGG
jgi:glycosyltransferase involved in cell wall biosynthesis